MSNGLKWLESIVFNGWWIIFWFILFVAFIILFAKLITSILEVIASKVKISKAFLGGVLMSFVVSLPELVASVFGGVEGNPMYSLYNETGSNMMQVFLLCSIMLSFFFIEMHKNKKIKNNIKTIESQTYQGCFGNMSGHNKFVLWSMVGIYFIFLIFLEVPAVGKVLYIPGINMSICSFIPFFIWIGLSIFALIKKETGHHMGPDVSKNIFFKYDIWVLWLLFAIVACFLILVSYINSGIVEQMAVVFNIPDQALATILLSFATSLPEIVSLIFLCRSKQYNLGLSTVTGGALINASFVFYTDAIITSGATFKDFHEVYLFGNDPSVPKIDATRMQYWIIVVFIITLLFSLTSIKKVSSSKVGLTSNLTSIVLTYIVGFLLVTILVK